MRKRDENRLKYKDILTKNFLEKEYSINKKSIAQLKKKLNIDWYTIKYYLEFHKIPLRTHKEQASISSPGGKHLYTNLLTKEYLIEFYTGRKKGIINLSRELKIDSGTIRRYLNKHKIPIRKSKDQININNPPKEFNLNKEIKSFLDGLLSGDASIPKRKDGIKPRSFTQACKHEEYLNYIQNILSKDEILCSPILSRWIKDERCKDKGYNQNFLQTRRYKTFELFRERWYPKGIKIIPMDLIITPDLLLQLYLCDGNFYREIRFCLDAFDMESINRLKELIEGKIDIKLRKTSTGLFIKKSDAGKFLSYIGPCPVKCYEYKWEDNESEEAKHRKRLKARLRYSTSKNESKRIQEKKSF